MSPTVKGAVFVFVASLFYSLTGTFRTIAPEEANSFVITEMRILIGCICIFFFCVCTHKLPRDCKLIPWKYIAECVMGSVAYQLFFFTAVKVVGVAVSTVVAMGVTPAFAALLTWAFYSKAPSRAWLVSTVATVIGVVCLNMTEMDMAQPLYLAFPILAGLGSSFYIDGCTRIIKKMPPETTVLVITASISLLLSPSLFIFPTAWIFTTDGMIVCLGLGVLTCGLAFPLFCAGTKYLMPAATATINMVEPVAAACIGIFWLHETCTVLTVAGIVLICLAVLYLVYKER